jgi:hypothetical protein
LDRIEADLISRFGDDQGLLPWVDYS